MSIDALEISRNLSASMGYLGNVSALATDEQIKNFADFTKRMMAEHKRTFETQVKSHRDAVLKAAPAIKERDMYVVKLYDALGAEGLKKEFVRVAPSKYPEYAHLAPKPAENELLSKKNMMIAGGAVAALGLAYVILK